ncbi:MAG: glycoside hydrolase family 3 N-terminal domain-containing protein [Ornithinimicrobium sp.]
MSESQAWRDTSLATDERVEALLGTMTLEEKVAQLGSFWAQANIGEGDVAPMANEMSQGGDEFADLIAGGLGHLTRVFGSAPISVAEGTAELIERQRQVMAANRFGIPAIAHEECLTGFTTSGATVYPTSLAWGATFDPELIHAMAAAIGSDMAAVGVDQGLSPVLDVARDPRWGRVEETMGEDPYLVSVLGTAYVTGLQSAGVMATLKHFAGYAASRGARNHGPVSIGPRELAEVVLPPFEMAVRAGQVASVMNSYADLDGVPPAADRRLLSDLLRDRWGFAGTVVSDYWAISFLQQMHHVADSPQACATVALSAGMDVELPQTGAFRTLPDSVRSGGIAEALVDRAAGRVLRQKVTLGMLDPGWSPHVDPERDLDSPGNRWLAAEVAQRSIVLLANDGTLPVVSGSAATQRVAVIGPGADDPHTLLGCYAFPNHVVGTGDDLGLPVDTVLEAIRTEYPSSEVTFARGCDIDSADTTGFAEAREVAAASDVVLLVVGDRAGLFGRGTSGEGCDRGDLALPGVQGTLVHEILTVAPAVVLVVVSGRPYALGDWAPQCAAIVQAFFPGVEGGAALAGVLSGRVNPSGRLPIGVPAGPGGQPASYRAAPLGRHTPGVSTLDPTALFPFGHGLSYGAVDYLEIDASARQLAVDGQVEVSVSVRGAGEVPLTEVVQLYLHDVQAQVARPALELIGFARVDLEPGHTRTVQFTVHADRLSFIGTDGTRVVEPGTVRLLAGPSSADLPLVVDIDLRGPLRQVEGARVMFTPTSLIS